MDLEFSEEQRLLAQSARRFLADNYDLPKRRERIADAPGFDRELWAQMCELGWLALRLPERLDGLGGGTVDCAVVMEAVGRALAVEPLVQNMVFAAALLDRSGCKDTELAQALATGKTLMAIAHAEPRSRYALNRVATRAEASDSGYRITGSKAVAHFAGAADKLILSARTQGNDNDKHGISLFIVDAGAAGLTVRDYPTVDGLRAADLSLEGVAVSTDALLSPVNGGLELLSTCMDEATVALCAEAIGAMDYLHAATLEYTKNRKQFGLPIGKFQVIQHRLVDMYIALELARSMTLLAAAGMDNGSPQERARLASTAKVKTGEAIRLIGQDAVQLHGGMGMTDELDISHYFKRITMIDATHGDVDFHLRRLVALQASDGLSH
ncbi:MAG: pimeloyl-CoA dehydrogenase small subunit [Gammaproteobacteria bacterium]|nr:pimeloyl-CoA dehydrogenase small subunit [Gammaproteobacteria bacterium]